MTTEGARGREGRGRRCPRGGHGLGLPTGTAVETGLGPSRQTGRLAPPKAAGIGRGVVEVVKLRKGMVMRYVFWQLTSFHCLYVIKYLFEEVVGPLVLISGAATLVTM